MTEPRKMYRVLGKISRRFSCVAGVSSELKQCVHCGTVNLDEDTLCGVCGRSLERVQSDAVLRNSSSSPKPGPRKRKTRVRVVIFGFLVAITVFGLASSLLANSPWRDVGFAVGMMGLILTIVMVIHFGKEYEQQQSRTVDPHSVHGGFGPPHHSHGDFGA